MDSGLAGFIMVDLKLQQFQRAAYRYLYNISPMSRTGRGLLRIRFGQDRNSYGEMLSLSSDFRVVRHLTNYNRVSRGSINAVYIHLTWNGQLWSPDDWGEEKIWDSNWIELRTDCCQ
jgi:hypothetical protein